MTCCNLPTVRHTLATLWEVHADTGHYLGCVRRVQHPDRLRARYEPEHPDGSPVVSGRHSTQPGWPDKKAAAAALARCAPHRLTLAWEVHAERTGEYLGRIRRVLQFRTTSYAVDRPDGILVAPATGGGSDDWPTSEAAAAALAGSYISNPA